MQILGVHGISEDNLEKMCLTWFQDSGWEYRYGPDLAWDGETPERTDYHQVLLLGRLLEALRRLNPNIPEHAHWKMSYPVSPSRTTHH